MPTSYFVVTARNVALGVFPTMAMAVESVEKTVDGVAWNRSRSPHCFRAAVAPDGTAFTVVQVFASPAAGLLF